MKRKAWIAAAVAASMLSAGSAVAASGTRGENREKVQNVRSRSTTSPSHRVVAFQTDRTDSWLCNNVSVFFCSDLIPHLNTSHSTNNAASQVPDRSRKPNQ